MYKFYPEMISSHLFLPLNLILPCSYSQPILLMCQIDIVIENVVDVFVVRVSFEWRRERKRKLENIEINIERTKWEGYPKKYNN